jgi:TRAP-type C4-dicarboxylate transport system permease small subunit
MLRRLERIVTGTANVIAVAGMTLLLLFAAATLSDGLSRGLFSAPIDMVREIGDLVAAICGTCCLPIVLLNKNNITLRVFEKLLPPVGVRVLESLVDLLLTVTMAAMAWQFWLLAVKTQQAGDVTWLMNVPKAPFWFVVDAILWVAAAVQLFVTLQTVTGQQTRQHHTETPV